MAPSYALCAGSCAGPSQPGPLMRLSFWLSPFVRTCPQASSSLAVICACQKRRRRAYRAPPSVATTACLDRYEDSEAVALVGVLAADTAAEDQVDSLTHTWGRRSDYTENRQDAILAVAERHAQLSHSTRGRWRRQG